MAERDELIYVNIFGTTYPIKGNADPGYVEEIAHYVDAKMREMSKSLSVPSTTKIAILAAMSIADELFAERAEREKTVSQLVERAAEISGWLEKELMEDPS